MHTKERAQVHETGTFEKTHLCDVNYDKPVCRTVLAMKCNEQELPLEKASKESIEPPLRTSLMQCVDECRYRENPNVKETRRTKTRNLP